MPIYEVTKRLTFTEEERELLNRMMAFVQGIDEEVCNSSSQCCQCPFASLCEYSCNVDRIERQMNEMFNN